MNLPAVSAPRRILVIRLQHHGDVLLTTPLFSALKHRFPGAEVDAMVYAETVPMIAANPDLTRIWPLPRRHQEGRGWRRLRNLLALLRDVRRRGYDWVLHLNDQWQGAMVAGASGASLRFSHEMDKRDRWLWRTIFPLRAPLDHSVHRVEANLAVLGALGLTMNPDDAVCTMAYPPSDAAFVRQRLTAAGVGERYVLVHPTSRWFFKCWEDDRFAAVIDAMAQSGRQVVLTAAPDQRELDLIDALLARIDHPGVVSLAGALTLPQLAAAIAGADLFLGVDSVPMHMAAALGVPVVALFGATHVHNWRPWSRQAIVIDASAYGPVIAPNDVDTSTTERYLKNIPVEPVLDAVRRQLDRKPLATSAVA